MIDVLTHHRQVRSQLTDRDPQGARHRRRLNRAIGVSTDRVLISTAEHIAPFNLSDTVSFLLPQLVLNALRPDERLGLVILGGALIPLDNRQLPRGFMLPAGDGRRQTFQLFPQRDMKTSPVAQPAACCATDSSFFRRFPWLLDLLTEASGSEVSYAAQMSRCMERIVQRWQIDGDPQPLAVRPLEEVARTVLIELLEEGDGFLDRVLFDDDARGAVEASLRGVFCAWGDAHGSFLFWRAHNRRMGRLRRLGNRLVADDGQEIAIERDALLHELRERRLWPGVFLSLCVVSLLPGIPICGGPKQVRYYERMMAAAEPFLDTPRRTPLSAFGYMCFDPSDLRPSPDADTIAAHGTGLDLAERAPDLPSLVQQLERLSIRSLSSFTPLPYQ